MAKSTVKTPWTKPAQRQVAEVEGALVGTQEVGTAAPAGTETTQLGVVGAPAGELHVVPVAIAADLLRWQGFEVVELGADTPAGALVEIECWAYLPEEK